MPVPNPTSTTRAPGMTRFRADLARSRRLFADFLVEQSDPDRFYCHLASDSAAQVDSYHRLDGATVLDVGGGPGYFAEAFEAAGARYIALDVDAGQIHLHGRTPAPCTVQADGMRLPFATGSLDVAYSSNVAEHVPHPWRMGEEMVRVVRPGGLVFLSYTLWYGPWGGHETAPWHLLGGHWASRRYAVRRGHEPKNLFGRSLYRVTAAEGLRWARNVDGARLVAATPRYLPTWTRPLVRVPGLREVALWNLVLVLRVDSP